MYEMNLITMLYTGSVILMLFCLQNGVGSRLQWALCLLDGPIVAESRRDPSVRFDHFSADGLGAGPQDDIMVFKLSQKE